MIFRHRAAATLLIALFLTTACTSRQWVSPGSYEIGQDACIYRVITTDADTVEYAGREVESVVSSTFSEEEFPRFSGRGASLVNGEIHGVLGDGSSMTVPYGDVSMMEIDASDTGRTVLLVSAAVIASGFLVYILATELLEDDPVTPGM